MPQYQGVWNLQDAARLQSQQQWVTDPNFRNTTLLLQADNAANSAQNNTFLDSSSNSFAITRNGNTTQGTFTPFSQGWSNFFDGTDDYLQRVSPASYLINWTSTNFTLEYWIYANAFGQGANTESNVIGNANDAGSSAYWTFGPISTGAVRFYYFTGASPTVTTTTTLNTGQWHHLAFVNNGGALTIYINGRSSATATISGTPLFDSSVAFTIGKITGSSFNGYLSNIRIAQSAVYTSNFTPSSIPLSATGAQLLTCQANRFLDASSNNTVFTAFGNTSVQPFAPFAPQFQYTQSVIGGSGYFDGSGDTLDTPATGQFAPTGDFTIGLWFYPNSALNINQNLVGNLTTNASTDWLIQMQSMTINFYTNGTTVRIAVSGAVRPFQWNYISMTRSSNVISAHVNGTSLGTYSQSGTFGSATKKIEIGNATSNVNGYISGLVFVDGTANISIPTAPPSPVGTSLCLNFTNAGIIDGTMDNVLETVGNAQVSTSVVKYGSGSIAFDGSGDYLRLPTSPNIGMGTGDFTIEFWIYRSANGNQIIFDQRSTATQVALCIFNDGNDIIRFFVNGSNVITGGTIPLATWTHFALCKASSLTRMFFNGVQVGSTYVDTNNYVTNPLFIGAQFDTASGVNGYLDDLRITKGVARYISNFTPPQVALPRQ